MSKLQELMSTPLPNKTQQKKLLYRPSLKETHRIYNLLNEEIFRGKLARPEIQLGQLKRAWGWCQGHEFPMKTGSRCIIRLSDKWFCVQWLVITLAHEMAHQYQWDVIALRRARLGKAGIMSHGPTFFQHRRRYERHNIPLKTAFRVKKWFKHQSFTRC